VVCIKYTNIPTYFNPASGIDWYSLSIIFSILLIKKNYWKTMIIKSQYGLYVTILLNALSMIESFKSGCWWVKGGSKFSSINIYASIDSLKMSTETLAPAISAQHNIRPSTTDKARTITHICTSGTLCTTSVMDGVQGFPFGSYVDYILDENGWPILLLSDQSLHTQNIQKNAGVSMFVQLPRSQQSQAAAALSRVTIMGHVEPVPTDLLTAMKFAFSIVHPYAEQIVDSPKFRFMRVKPEKIYFSGGFGVQATWVNVEEYEKAKPDVLAHDVPNVLSRVNMDKQGELLLMCKHFLKLENVEVARIQAIDKLGVDIRVKSGKINTVSTLS
jgi:putative heme iron utilization protein